MAEVLHESTGANEPAGIKTPKKAALASWIGSALEYYDFFIYGTGAALVFNKVFFASSDPATGTLLALATFGVGYVARPIGAFFMGHVGDRFGRKKVLVFTLILMGASTFLVGCLPTYNQVGVWAPTLLVFLRLCQGFSASGEQAGANSMTLEHAPAHRRAFFTSFTLSGTQAGLIIATAVFLPIASLPEEHHEVARMPLAVLFRDYLPDIARVILGALVSVVSTIFGVYALSYAVNTVHIPRSTMLWVAI